MRSTRLPKLEKIVEEFNFFFQPGMIISCHEVLFVYPFIDPPPDSLGYKISKEMNIVGAGQGVFLLDVLLKDYNVYLKVLVSEKLPIGYICVTRLGVERFKELRD